MSLDNITIMSGRKVTGKLQGKRFIIDKGAWKNGGAKHVTRQSFASDKAALTGVLAMTGVIDRVPYGGCASIILDGVKITGYFAPAATRRVCGRYRRVVERVTVSQIKAK